MHLRSVLLVAALLVACSDQAAPDQGDAAADASAGGCCAPSPGPDCCMDYGGYSSDGRCGETCDGMPLPSDPGWKLVKDGHGCDVWTNPRGTIVGDGCGSLPPPPDAGGDAGADAAADAGADAAADAAATLDASSD